MAAEVVVEQAPAKVNLVLWVGPRRDDGLHELCSLVASIDLADTLRFESVGTEDEVHDDEISASRGTTEPLGPDDVRMSQPGDRAGLADETLDHPRMVQERFPEEFHGDITSLAVLMCLVNLSHPPCPDQPSQQEVMVRKQEDLGVRIGRSSRRGVS